MEQTTLIQCECQGWMSPKAIYCPTCGAPVNNTTKPNAYRVGWGIVGWFWTSVVVALIVLVVVA